MVNNPVYRKKSKPQFNINFNLKKSILEYIIFIFRFTRKHIIILFQKKHTCMIYIRWFPLTIKLPILNRPIIAYCRSVICKIGDRPFASPLKDGIGQDGTIPGKHLLGSYFQAYFKHTNFRDMVWHNFCYQNYFSISINFACFFSMHLTVFPVIVCCVITCRCIVKQSKLIEIQYT